MVTPPTPDLAGYAVYLAGLFLPGLGLGEFLDLWPDDRTVVDVLAYSLGLGLAVDTLVILVRTSGLTIGGIVLKGLDLTTVYSLVAIGLVLLLASVAWRREMGFLVKPRKADLAFLLLVLVTVLVESAYFAKYPFFPRNESQDFQNHAQYVISLVNGNVASVPTGILYYGVHFQLGAALLLVGGEPLVTVQRTMALLVALSPLLFYLAARSLFSTRLPALIVTAIYALSGTIWFVAIFVSGLFPNFFGIMAVLFFITMYCCVAANIRKKRFWIPFLLSVVMLYVSHFTALTIFPALLLLPVIQYAKERKDSLRFLVPSVVLLVPVGAVVAADPNLLNLLISIAENSGGLVGISTPLSTALSAAPILGYIAADLYDDVAFVFLFAFTAVYIIRGLRGRATNVWVPLLWFATLVAATAFTSDVWRYSYEALVPLTLMAGYGLFVLFPQEGRAPRGLKRRKGGASGRSLLVIGAIILLLVPIIATSWTEVSVSDSSSDPGDSASTQSSVYTAIYWLKGNTPNGSSYLSATDWRFTYANLIISRHTFSVPNGQCFTDPQQAISTAKNKSAGYIIVTNYETCPPPASQSTLWTTLQPSSNLTLVYQDDDVRIFQVV